MSSTPPDGPFETIDATLAAADTWRQHGDPTLAQVALGIARTKIGERETGRNRGAIVDWCLEGLSSTPAEGGGEDQRRPGWAAWCAFFVCQAYRRALLASADPERADRLRAWCGRPRLASGDCDVLWERLSAQGLTWARGVAVPQSGDIIFFGREGDLRHVGLVDRVAGLLVHTVEGNHGDAVAEDSYRLDDDKICGYGRFPW